MNHTPLTPPIGCFGGTFNPPHTAHFALVHSAREQLHLEQVLMIPTGQPWQKPDVLPVTHRINMLRAALKYDEQVWHNKQHKQAIPYPLSLDTTESDLPEASYTITTLKTLRQRYPHTPLVWIMGSDQLKNLQTWRDWQDLLHYAHIAVAQRAGHYVDSSELLEPLCNLYAERVTTHAAQWRNNLCGHFIPFTLTALHISSSAIRSEIHNGKDPHLLPALRPAVADYITTHHLYQESL